MRNRLTFPTAGTETKYVWDRHNIQNNGIYIWDKHNIIEETKYYWDKYSILQEKIYNWAKYSTSTETTYNWNRYTLTTADATFTANNYIFHVKNMATKTKYLNLSNSLTNKPTDAVYATGTFVYLYKADNTYLQMQVSNVKNNLFTCNPLYYGFVGFSKSTTYNAPSWYFTADTEMKVVDGSLCFTNLYNTSQNMYIYPKSLTDSPTGSAYMALTMPWPTTLKNINTYSKTTTLASRFHRIVGTTFYEVLNDGFWLTNNNAIGAQIKDENSLTTLSSKSSTTYPTGVSGNYLYSKGTNTYTTIKGDYIQDVTSKEQNAYPQDGVQGDYWYVTKPIGTYYWEKYSNTQYAWDEYNVKSTGNLKPFTANKSPYRTPAGIVTLTFNTWTTRPNNNTYTIEEDVELNWGGLFSYRYNPYTEAMEELPVTDILHENLDNHIELEELRTTKAEYKVQDVSDLYCAQDGDGWGLLYYIVTKDSTLEVVEGGDIVLKHLTKISFGQGNYLNPTFEGEYNYSPVYRDGDYSSPTSTTGVSLGSYTQGGVTYYIREHRIAFGNPRTIMTTENAVEVTIDTDSSAYEEICDNYLYASWTSSYATRNAKSVIYGSDGYRYEFDTIADILVEPTTTTGKTKYSTDRNAYPDDGQVYIGNYASRPNQYKWYKYKGLSSGTLIETVNSSDANAYPNAGEQDGYYYQFLRFVEDAPVYKGDYIGVVESLNPKEYPNNHYQDQNWYIYTGSKLFHYLGSYIETVNAETINEYPKDGITGGYWYIYQRYEDNGPYKSRWVDEVETNNSTSYPADGIQGDYWYVYKKSYEGYKLQINDWQIKGGVDYKHNVNPEKDFTIGCVASAEIDFDYDNTADDFQQYLDADYCDYWTWQPEDSTWRLIGRFWLTDAEYNRNLVKVKAFDAILATDAYVDEFIANTTYPISVTNFFNNLCQLLGVTGKINSSLANTTFAFQDNFEAINITARQLLQYIAEATGGFIKVEPDGTLYLTTYSSSGKTLDNSNYTSYAKQRYTVEPISGLTVKMNSDDLGVSSGDVENNPYIIENNPLFYTQSDEEIAGAVNHLYNSINDKVYRPATIQLLQDFGINCGDIITINGDTFYVMSKELSASGCKLECFGNQYRDKKAQSINSDIVALRGKTNELYRDLEMTQSTLTDTANGLQSQITQTAEEINLRVTNEVEGLESEISQTAGQISTRITNEVAGLESKITQTADSITSSVTDEINQAKSEIKQTTDSISLQVQNQGDLVAQLVLDVDGITAKGYVTFTDLAGSGKTTINGDNITTGTISADRINLTGSISWGDLTQSCKNTIASYAGDSDLPDYIHSTYIDSTVIKSPTIQGGTLYAGNVWEGYCRMTSSGLNVVSDTGGNICGIGWEPNYYNLPYLVLGAGVDDAGTNSGMIKKYTHGIWIGDNDSVGATEARYPTAGTGIFVDFEENKVYKYINGTKTAL